MNFLSSRLFAVILVCLLVLPDVRGDSFERILLISNIISGDSAAGVSGSAERPVSYSNAAFELTYGSGLQNSAEAQTAFNKAVNAWSGVLKDEVTVRLDLDFDSLGLGVLGSTASTGLYGDYTEVRDMVSENLGETNNPRESLLLPNLPTYNQFQAYLPSGFDFDGNMLISQANYHALGGSDPQFNTSDGSITFSSDYAWDFDPSDGIQPGKYDFVGVAVHEIGHALGFISDVDFIDNTLQDGEVSDEVWPSTADLFRFSTEEVLDPEFNFSTSPRDMTPGGNDVFYHGDGSIPMSTGVYAGDGRQASHWKDDLALGIMDPTAEMGELLKISPYDLIAFDLIGWDIDWQLIEAGWNELPEPASITLFALAATALLKRQKGRKNSPIRQ